MSSPVAALSGVSDSIDWGDVYLNGYFPTLSIDTTPIASSHSDYAHFNSLHQRYLGISRTIRRPGTAVMSHPSQEFEFGFSEPIEIRGRGNTTWNSMGEKRPYRFRFTQRIPDLDRDRYMLDSDYHAREWALVANVLDPSFMRTYGVMYLGRLLGTMDFVPSLWFVHLYLNGDYRGVYMLMDQPRNSNGPRLGIDYTNPDPTQAEYLIEMCRHPKDEPYGVDWIRINGKPFEISSLPDQFFGPNSDHVDYVREFLTKVDNAIASGCKDAFSGIVDVDSFIDFYIINEFIKNRDVGFGSVYYTIRNTDDGRRLFAGPLWDFDQSGGATVDGIFARGFRPTGVWAANQRATHTFQHGNVWMAIMMGHDWFHEMVAERWNEIRNDELLQMINRVSQKAQDFESEFYRNFERFPHHLTTPTWRNSPLFNPEINTFVEDGFTYMAQVDYLIWWMNARADWFDDFMDGTYVPRRQLTLGEVTAIVGTSVGVFILGTVFIYWLALRPKK